ncbi:hypothetical protein M413DRAFT_25762 [Hebeloma cylindrosporum]|uniref:F-box domain-containing protein n=1 Tax=Hebeloma cylindrosporum TaxID=76867 RepID=A0A0C3CKM5_HEBCY|nr:hypothetical protein M413DRAFT_25762 [Hebeloma cylindrosporum h7]
MITTLIQSHVRTQPPLLSLPPELIEAITGRTRPGEYPLSINAVKDLCLSCKQLGECLNSRVFCKLTISFTRTSYENEPFKIRILATKKCHAASSETRTLKITSLSPAYEVNGESEGLPRVTSEEALKRYLFKAIAALRSVQSVEWTPGEKDSEWAQKDVMNALKTLPKLRVLILDTAHFKFPLPFHDLSNIQEISVRIQVTNMAQIYLINSPNWSLGVPRSPLLTLKATHKANWHEPESSLDLQALPIKVFSSPAAPSFVEHLTSLSLMAIRDPRVPWGTNGASEAERSEYGSSLDDIWKALKLSRIYLQELTLDAVVPSVLEYLASYSGLKKLCITPGNFQDGNSPDSMARQFFSTPFMNHVQSLEHLSISPIYEGS